MTCSASSSSLRALSRAVARSLRVVGAAPGPMSSPLAEVSTVAIAYPSNSSSLSHLTANRQSPPRT
jgi:hypothetical protein